MALDGLDEGAYDPIVFGIDVDASFREGVEEFVQSGNVLHAADPCLGYLGGRTFRDDTGPIGHSVQRVIVEGQDDAVSGEVDVGLQIAVAKGDSVGEGGQAVLRMFLGTTPVGEGQWPGVVQIGAESGGLQEAQGRWRWRGGSLMGWPVGPRSSPPSDPRRTARRPSAT